MILALAVLGLSASLVTEKVCNSEYCVFTLRTLWEELAHITSGLRTTRYCTFLGIYGIVIASVGTASLFVDRIPLVAPLVGDSIGALLYMAGGIAWGINLSKLPYSCGEFKKAYQNTWYMDSLVSVCRRCEADHGLVWALFGCTAALAICDLLRRRDQVQSLK